MGSRRGPEQTIGQQNFKMKFLLVLCLLGLVAGSEDYKMFMKWAKTKAMESCWGEDNMMVNNMVSMAGHKEDQHHEMEYFTRFFRFMQMMKMMNHDDHHSEVKTYSQMNQDSDMNMMEKFKMMKMMKEMMNNKNYEYDGYDNTKRHNEEPSMYNFVKKMGYQNENEDYMKSGSGLESMFRSMGQVRYKRQAGDSLALNDRLKEKLEHMMEEHVEEISNMTCVLRELNVIDQNNN